MSESDKVIIVGAGLVGSLAAIYMARLGYVVEVFEKRSDIRKDLVFEGKSINLALSARGIEALKTVGLDVRVLESAIPMKARMIHGSNDHITSIPYGDFGETIKSVGRRSLNELLLDAAEAEENVSFHFEHELLSLDADNGEVMFKNLKNRKQIVKKADFILGCDGAYSAVRRELIKVARIDFSQEYIKHGYKEFCILADDKDTWKLPQEYLHIWPRYEYMLIALPNIDGSFTGTLFYPHESFEAIKTDKDVLMLFKTQFPKALELIGEKNVCHAYWNNPTGALVTMRCSKYHYKDKVLLLGDAAHAMVPFYGQGMNAGFEDLLVLGKLLKEHPHSKAFSEYSRIRKPDAYAICDLALYNYWEMSSGVNSRIFRWKRTIFGLMHKLLPLRIKPLYSMVAFTTIPYSEVARRNQRQEHILRLFAGSMGFGLIGALTYFGIFMYNKLGNR